MTKTKKKKEAPADAAETSARRVALADLKFDPDNARIHDERNVRAIKASLIEFGQVVPLIVEKGTSVVIGGNATLRAMREMGWKDCEVREVDEHGKRAVALALALNRTGELAEWDDEVLARQLRGQLYDFDMEAMGWDDLELRKLVGKKLHIPGEDQGFAQDDRGLHYRIIIDCTGEDHQAALLERLESEGVTCEPLIS